MNAHSFARSFLFAGLLFLAGCSAKAPACYAKGSPEGLQKLYFRAQTDGIVDVPMSTLATIERCYKSSAKSDESILGDVHVDPPWDLNFVEVRSLGDDRKILAFTLSGVTDVRFVVLTDEGYRPLEAAVIGIY